MSQSSGRNKVHFSSSRMTKKVYWKRGRQSCISSCVFAMISGLRWKRKRKPRVTHIHMHILSAVLTKTHFLFLKVCIVVVAGVDWGGMSCSSFTYCLQKTHIPAVVNGVTQSTRLPKFPFLVIIFTPDLTRIFFYSTETSDSLKKRKMKQMYRE